MKALYFFVLLDSIFLIAGAEGATGQKSSKFPTFSSGNTVTNEDLEKLSEALFNAELNYALKFITLNFQQQISANDTVDKAPQPLLDVKEDALKIPTMQNVMSIYDYVNFDAKTTKYMTRTQRHKEDLLLDTFLHTDVMFYTRRTLAKKKLVKMDYLLFKYHLKQIWFNPYPVDEGQIISNGFKQVFMSEINSKNEVLGFNNWIYFNTKERENRVNYLGYIDKLSLGDKAAILKFNLQYNGLYKPNATMFIGTSPELEMALYTVCFFARPDQLCPLSLGGTKFNIITQKINYNNIDHVGYAYPEI